MIFIKLHHYILFFICNTWEQRKLGEMMNITSVKRIHQSDWTDSGVRFLRARDIVAASKNEEPDDYLYISEEKYEEYSALSGKVDIDDLLVTGVGTIGVPYLVENLEPLYFKDGNIIWFQNKNKIDGKFLYYSFIGNGIQSFIKASAGTGTVGTYTIDTGKKTPIQFPSKEEQKKIGEYLTNLDHLITLHQRKYFIIYNKLITWEQRKLGELVDVYDGVHQTPDYQDSGIMFLSVENISTLKSNKYISTEAFERDYKVYPEKGDILMTRIGDIGTTNVVESTDKMAFYVSLALLKLKDIDSYFLSNAMKNEPFQKGLRQRSLLTAIPQKINKEEIGKTDIFITKNPVEQKKIGEYFSTLDHLITLHRRAL